MLPPPLLCDVIYGYLLNKFSLFSRKSFVNVADVDYLVEKTLNPLFKGAYLASKDSVLYYNLEHRNNHTLKICKEILYNRQFGIYFPRNTFLKEIFDEKINQFLQYGFIEEWVSRYTHTEVDDSTLR